MNTTTTTSTPTLSQISRNASFNATVWVGNWGRYNEGDLMGEWITLPVSDEQLALFLREQVGIDGIKYEEYGIMDSFTDGMPEMLGVTGIIGEWTDLEDLNTLCRIIREKTDTVPDITDRVEVAATATGADTIEELANLAWQAEDIPYTPFNDAGNPTLTAEEKLAYTLLENGCLPELQETYESRWGTYIDIDKLGRDLAMDYTMSESGCIDQNDDMPATDMYTLDEIKAELADL